MALLYTPANPRSTRIYQRPVVGCRTRISLQRSIAAVFATDFGNLNWRHLESGRRRLTRTMRRARVWIRARLTQPLTAKGKQSRMGKGKGKLRGWTGYVRPGTLLYELSPTARAARVEHPSRYTRATGKFPYGDVARKLPFGVKVVRRAASEARQHRQFLTFRARQQGVSFGPKQATAFRSQKKSVGAEAQTCEANDSDAPHESTRAFPVATVCFLWRALQRWETHCGVAVPTSLRSFGTPLLTSVTEIVGTTTTANSAKPESAADRKGGAAAVAGAPNSRSPEQSGIGASPTEVELSGSYGRKGTLKSPSNFRKDSHTEKQVGPHSKKMLSGRQSDQGQNLHRLKRHLARGSRSIFPELARRLLSPLALRRYPLRRKTFALQQRKALRQERAALVRLLRRDGAVVHRTKRLQLRRTKRMAGLWATRTQSSEQPQPAFGSQFCVSTRATFASERALRSLRGVGPGLRFLCMEEARAAQRLKLAQKKMEQFRQRSRRRSRGRRRSLRQRHWGSWQALRLRRASAAGFRNRKQLPARPPLAC